MIEDNSIVLLQNYEIFNEVGDYLKGGGNISLTKLQCNSLESVFNNIKNLIISAPINLESIFESSMKNLIINNLLVQF